jgi:hypothetical protein
MKQGGISKLNLHGIGDNHLSDPDYRTLRSITKNVIEENGM